MYLKSIIFFIFSFIIAGLSSCNFVDDNILRYYRNRFINFAFENFESRFFKVQINYSDIYMDNYDVISQNLQIKPNFSNNSIEAKNSIFLTIIQKTDRINFNFFSSFTIYNITSSKEIKSFRYQNNYLTVLFKDSLFKEDSVFISIDYSGKPKSFSNNGFFIGKNEFGNFCFALNESNLAHSWFPCKDIPSDKFISEMSIIVPTGLIAVSNGILTDKIQIDSSTKFHYKSSYPISSYLVSFAVGKYLVISDSVKSTSGDIFPLEYYFFPNQKDAAQKDFDNHKKYFKFFETLFGPYPFRKEKYSVVCVDWNFGGMENQTITFIGKRFIDGFRMNDNLLSHELAHSWFGNSVTLKYWKDIWLNESFATFAEYLFEHYNSSKKTESEIFAKLFNSFYFGSVHNPQNFLLSNTVYGKGAFVLYMLKNQIGDSLFYNIINKFITNYQYKNVSTEEFIDFFQNNSLLNFGKFFNQWIYTDIDRPMLLTSFSCDSTTDFYKYLIEAEQIQPDSLFQFCLPVRIITSDKKFFDTTISINNRKTKFIYNTKKRITQIDYNYNKSILISIIK